MNERYEAWQRNLNSPPGLSRKEEKLRFDAILDEYAAIKRELFLNGFAEYVFKQGYGAAAPNKNNGKLESWQDVGRRLWGKECFNKAFEQVIERSRAAKTHTRTSQGSASQ